jgi:tetratricopeptide (TPR) repeat protein
MPSNMQIQNWLNDFDTANARGHGTEGIEQLIVRISAANADAAIWQQAAEYLFREGQFAATAMVLDAALSRHGDLPGLRYLHGNALRLLGQFDHAERDFRSALAGNPAYRDATMSLAYMLREQGRIDAASIAIVALWKASKDDREIALTSLEFLRECGAHAHAGEIAHYAAATWPNDARLNALSGEIVLAIGDFDAAQTMLRRALDRDPGQTAACLRLAQCQRFTRADDPDLERFRTILAEKKLGRLSKVCAGFALGKALDDLSEFAEATDVLRAANGAAAEDVVWNGDDWRRFVDAQIETPTLASSRSIDTSHGPISNDPGFTPIFVVGLPRSGTTLVATRLGQRADVRDRGELNWIPAMHEHLRSQGGLNDPQALSAVARLLTVQMRRDDGSSKYVIDKNPLNFRYLSFIQSLFPNARIIHCQRGERDIALSMWQQHFAHPDLAFSYRFDTIASFIQGYRRLMKHWRSATTLACLDLNYEALVADETAESRRIEQFLALSATTARETHTPSTITTASVWQARQPVYQRSVGRWKNYATYLPELERLFAE